MRVLAAVVSLLLLITPWERAARLAESGDLEGAEAEYRVILQATPDDPRVHYNLGTVLLRQGRFEEARPHLERAAAAADRVQDAAHYNLGNTDLEPAFAATDLPDRVDRLRRSIEAYKAALLLNPADLDSKWNLELARSLLEEEAEQEAPDAGGGGGGGGGDGPPDSGQADQTPRAAGGAGGEPEMSPAEAEELLSAASEEELRVQQDRLRKPQPPGPIRP